MAHHRATNGWVVLVHGLREDLHEQSLVSAFKYGWGAFCADNNLNVGDTCFFSMICVATYSNDDDKEVELEEWEEELEDDEAKLKVEVRKTNGDGGGELSTRVDTICILLFHQNYYSVCQDF